MLGSSPDHLTWGLLLAPQTRARHRAELRLDAEHVARLGLRPTSWLIRCEQPVQVTAGQHLGRLPSSVWSEVKRTAYHAMAAARLETPRATVRSLRVPRASWAG